MHNKLITLPILSAILLLFLMLTGCTTTTGVSGSQQADESQTPGTDVLDGSNNYYDTRGDANAYPYNSGTTPSGQLASGGSNSANRIVYFDFDSYEVRPEYHSMIEAHAGQMLANPNLLVVLEGHTDERGTREYNIGLGDRRSEAVRRVIIAFGVSPRQITVVSYGEERPASSGQDETSYSLNRRVEIVY